MLYIILFNNLFLGEDIVINCLGNQYKLGMVYDHCSNNTPKLAYNINLPVFNKRRETQIHSISKLDIIDVDNLYCRCGIDDNLKLSILIGLVEPCGAGAALIDHLSNTESIALHFKCTTKIEKKSDHLDLCINLKEGTYVVDEVRYGIDAIFIIDKHTCHFECDIVTKIKSAIDQESFEEIEDIGGTLYVDDTVKLPFEVKKFKDMHCFVSEVERMLKEKKINSIPIEVKLKYQKPIYKIDLKLTEEVAIIIQHLNSALKKCAKLYKMHFLTEGMETKIEMLENLITKYRDNLKQELSNLLPKIREGSKDVVILRRILERHSASPFNKELNEEISAITKEIGAFKKYISKIDDINGKEY